MMFAAPVAKSGGLSGGGSGGGSQLSITLSKAQVEAGCQCGHFCARVRKAIAETGAREEKRQLSWPTVIRSSQSFGRTRNPVHT
jgi:hypothetical protein